MLKLMPTVMIQSFRTDMPGKQCRPRSDCSSRSSLIRVYTVCHSICIIWIHYSMIEPHSSNFRVLTTNFLGVRIFRKFTVYYSSWYTDIFLSVCINSFLTDFRRSIVKCICILKVLKKRISCWSGGKYLFSHQKVKFAVFSYPLQNLLLPFASLMSEERK